MATTRSTPPGRGQAAHHAARPQIEVGQLRAQSSPPLCKYSLLSAVRRSIDAKKIWLKCIPLA
eukprot:4269567-Prorocentrum_lima.AAC.1